MSKCPILHEAWRSRLGASVGPGPLADVTLPCFTARPSKAQQAPLGCQAQATPREQLQLALLTERQAHRPRTER